MKGHLNGIADIRAVIENERMLCGAVECKKIRLRSGEEFANPVITYVDACGGTLYSLSFVSDQGERLIAHVNDIGLIVEPVHKRVCELKNQHAKTEKLHERLVYLKRLCELNEGFCTAPFLQEVKALVDDTGWRLQKRMFLCLS